MATSLNASLNVSLNPQSLNASTKQIQQALGRITGQASEFQKSLDASTARVFAFGATTVVINGVTQSFKKLVSTTIDVQKRLVEINSIFQATDATFNKFRNSIFQVAKETGQSFNIVAEGAAELARQGLSAEETASRLKSALILTRISGLDAEKSVKALTAAINGFTSAGLSANQIVNKLVAVDTAFAVSAQDLAEAFSRAGSTAEDAGVSFNELLGLVTAVEQKTARGGAVIGNAFKSIFTRLQRGTTIEELKELGVQIDATQSGVQKLMALSTAIEGIADPTVVSKIKELAGGVFQINVVSAALKDLGSNTSIFQKAAVTAAGATSEALEKNAALNQTISAQINSLVVGLTSLAERIGSITFGPLLEGLVGITTKITDFLDKALDPEKGNIFVKGLFKTIGAFLSGPAVVIFTAAFVKIFKLVATFAGQGLKTLFQMGTQTERIKQIEGGIVGLLQRDQQLRNAITSSTTSQLQKEQAVIQAIQRENALLQQQAQLMRSLASAAAARGVTGMGTGGTFTGRRGRAFATGFMQEEATARMLGASAGVQAHFGKGRIDGRRFVMNDEEIEIPNFAGGNSAVIPMYAGGNMPRYTRGFLPPLKSRTDITTREGAIAAGYSGAAASSRFGPAPKKAKTPTMEDVIQVNPSGAAMLIPSIGVTTKIPKGTSGRFKFKGKRMGFEYGAGLGVFGPKVPTAVDQAADPHDERLRKNITRGVTTSAANYAGLLQPLLGKPKPSAIRKMMERQGGGKGALRGVVGAAFEAAVNVGLGISPAKRTDGGDFDIKGVSGEKQADAVKLFGVKNKATNLFDYKENAGRGSFTSFAKKLANQGKFTTVKRPVRRGFAGGYMPKFAKGSEKSGGIGESIMNKGTGLAIAFGSLQMAVNTFGASLGQGTNSVVSNTEERQNEILASKKSFSEKMKEIKELKKATSATKEASSAMVDLVDTINMVVTGLMAAQALNMVTGGVIPRGAGAVGGFIGKTGKGIRNVSDKRFGAQMSRQHLGGKATIGDFRSSLIGSVNRNAPMGAFGGNKKRALADVDRRVMKANEAVQKATAARNAKIAAKSANMARAGKVTGIAGKVATPLGVGLAGFEAFSASKAQKAGEISKQERNQRIGGAGLALAGGLGGAKAGAAIGAMVGGPAAPITALIGGLIGGGIGAFAGNKAGSAIGGQFGSSRIPMNEAEATLFAANKRNRELGFVNDGDEGSQSSERFNQRVQKNLSQLEAAGQDTSIMVQEYMTALESQIEISQNAEATEEERQAADDKVLAASRRLAGMRFKHIQAQEDWEKRNMKAQIALTESTERLRKARKSSANIERMVSDKFNTSAGGFRGSIKSQNERAQLQAGLKTNSKFGGAAMLASEQNAMMTNLAQLQQDRAMAQAAATAAQDSGASPEVVKDLVEASKEAGQKFKEEALKAGTNFLNKITTSQKLIEDNAKKINKLREGAMIGRGNMVDNFVNQGGINFDRMSKDLENIFNLSEKKNRTGAETDRMARAVATLDKQGTQLETDKILMEFLTEVKKMNETEAKAKIDEIRGASLDRFTTAKTEGGQALRDALKKDILEKFGGALDESAQDLIQAQANLKLELQNTEAVYKQFRENPATKGFATVLENLKKELDGAGATMGGLKKYVDNNMQASEQAAKFIGEAKDFFEEKREELKALKGDVADNKRRLAEIQGEGNL